MVELLFQTSPIIDHKKSKLSSTKKGKSKTLNDKKYTIILNFLTLFMLKIKSTTTGPNLRKMNYCLGPPICTSIE